MSNELILEIGTEEIPALFLEESTVSFRDNIVRRFNDNSLEFENVEIFYTPRRITARVTGLLPEQKDRIIETFGPPSNIAYDDSGNPTKAAIGFARSQGVDIKDLTVTKRDKGEFLSFRKKIEGDRTTKVLKDLVPELIKSIPFRKSMRWGKEKVTFARPIRWLMCTYNNETIDFRIENVQSSSVTYGHRFLEDNSFEPGSWEDYVKGLRDRYVILDQSERKEMIAGKAKELADNLGGYIEEDNELLETVTNLVEYPVVLEGNFEQKFINLPDEVLTSVMKNHQKYFPVIDSGSGNIIPSFIFVCGSPVKDEQVVIRGNERVLRARLNDAEFFYTEDIKVPLIEKLEDLKDMVFISEIGNFYEKMERLETIATKLAGFCGKDENFKNDISRAARLCKIDLVSQMVFEFPELQGTMGKYYAANSKEKRSVATAIEEHYMPTGRDSSLPASQLGSLLSITDKIDNISSCFAAGLKPTGSADPYALRRQAIGIIQITLNNQFNFSINELINTAVEQINIDFDKGTCSKEVNDFLAERFKHLLIEKGFTNKVIDSVVSTGFRNIVDCFNRIKALEKFRKQKDFEELAIAFKRVVNIAKEKPDSELDTELFEHEAESDLYNSFLEIRRETEEHLKINNRIPDEQDYLGVLDSIKTLKEPVDKFFDSVMVMAEDKRLKNNRMALLSEIKDFFFRISDFSKI